MFSESWRAEENSAGLLNTNCPSEDPPRTPQKIQTKRHRLTNPWITNGLINSINHNNFLYKRWKKSSKNKIDQPNSELLYQQYSNYRKHLKYLINCAKKLYHSKKFEKVQGNDKKTWKLINELRGKDKYKSKSSFLINGSLIKDRRIIANEFNQYFTSIAVKLNENIDFNGIPIIDIPKFDKYLNKKISDSIFFDKCNEDEIIEIIKDSNNNKASDISIKVLKSCCTIITPYLKHFLTNGIFPSIFKFG